MLPPAPATRCARPVYERYPRRDATAIWHPLGLGLEQQANAQLAFRNYDLDAAIAFYRAAYAKYAEAKRLDLNYVVNGQAEIGYSQMALGRMDSAIHYASHAVTIAEHYHSPCSREVAYAHFALGGIHDVAEDLDRTAAHYQLAVQAFEEVLPKGHPHLVKVLVDLSSLQSDRGNMNRALVYAQDAVRRSAGTDPHIQSAATGQYAALLAQLGLNADSYYWGQIARRHSVAAWGPDHVNQTGTIRAW